ncbi:nitric oxide-associated protein 1 [Ascaphus truei]|uniref:nitric oxide-associated protein 1 n=1 Tax=Ascaphus truei TaxID=8439 RepID=UPI003F59AC63
MLCLHAAFCRFPRWTPRMKILHPILIRPKRNRIEGAFHPLRFFLTRDGREARGVRIKATARSQQQQQQQQEEFVFPELADNAFDQEDECSYGRRLHDEYQKLITETRKKQKGARSCPEVYNQALQQQVTTLQPLLEELKLKEANYRTDLTAAIKFTDVGCSSVLPNKTNMKKKEMKTKGEHKIYGNPNPHLHVNGKQCSGCGAVMHCLDPSLPGYLPSEKYAHFLQQDKSTEKVVMCQRCYLLVHHHKALNVTVSQEEYKHIVRGIRTKKALVLFMVDMLDVPNAVIPDLLDLVGESKSILVLGNKIDLLPGDSPGYLKHLKAQLELYCTKAGINRTGNMTDVHLISAKTGYGVEELISKLQRSWKYKGDVYLVGTTNAGKTTLFNTLLQSDYCKAKASEMIKMATISPWPGTTLNLLKFPIVNPTPYRMFRRQGRLKDELTKSEEDLCEKEQKHLKYLKKHGYVIGRVGRTFQPLKKQKEDIEFDADSLSFGIEDDAPLVSPSDSSRETMQFTANELKDAHWFFDTPGIVKEDCVLNHLNDKEVKIVLPTYAIIPRTFVLQPGMTLFLGALGRIDFLQGEKSAWFSVVASNLLPVHVTSSNKADDIYQKHAGKTLLGVPIGEERMKEFPPLVPQDIKLEGIGAFEAVADVKLSTAGWVAVTAHSGQWLHLRCYTPKGTLLTIRKPPLLPLIVNIKGERFKKSPAYATKKPPPLVKI